jgi:hypothetical protein
MFIKAGPNTLVQVESMDSLPFRFRFMFMFVKEGMGRERGTFLTTPFIKECVLFIFLVGTAS